MNKHLVTFAGLSLHFSLLFTIPSFLSSVSWIRLHVLGPVVSIFLGPLKLFSFFFFSSRGQLPHSFTSLGFSSILLLPLVFPCSQSLSLFPRLLLSSFPFSLSFPPSPTLGLFPLLTLTLFFFFAPCFFASLQFLSFSLLNWSLSFFSLAPSSYILTPSLSSSVFLTLRSCLSFSLLDYTLSLFLGLPLLASLPLGFFHSLSSSQFLLYVFFRFLSLSFSYFHRLSIFASYLDLPLFTQSHRLPHPHVFLLFLFFSSRSHLSALTLRLSTLSLFFASGPLSRALFLFLFLFTLGFFPSLGFTRSP